MHSSLLHFMVHYITKIYYPSMQVMLVKSYSSFAMVKHSNITPRGIICDKSISFNPADVACSKKLKCPQNLLKLCHGKTL
jgi:hypothetical protein